MKENIFKYKLDFSGVKSIARMPINSKILDIQIQNNDIVIWALIEEDKSLVDREFIILGTGHGIPEKYDTTFLYHKKTLQNGELVWHIFEYSTF